LQVTDEATRRAGFKPQNKLRKMKDNLNTKVSNEAQNPAFLVGAVRRSFSLKNLIKSKNKYDSEIDNIYKKLEFFVEFDFFIMYQPSDGFVIVHQENCHNAPLLKCIGIIERYGRLSYDNYLDECI
jgi:hypothetical protein